jgi:uncharacterized membrane protein YbjE (DUF340 family)
MIKYILVALVLGAMAGYVNSNWGNAVAGFWVSDYMFNASLVLLLFVMGLVFGMDRDALAKMRRMGLRILIVPFLVALGSVLGGLVGGLVLRMDVFGSMAVSAGYGWYTLAGPLVGQIFGAEWGALGFAVNFLRELMTIIGMPLFVKIDKYAPIASGGATTSDTTLPIITRYCGSETLITAFSSGFTLSLAAPFTIVAIASLR